MKNIGIDPGMNGSGVAIMLDGFLIELHYLQMWELFDLLNFEDRLPIHVYVENSNLVKGNWHGSTGRSNVGKNKAISQTIVNFLKAHDIPHTELKPNGYSQTFKDAKLFNRVSGWTERSNEHQRASYAMICGRK